MGRLCGIPHFLNKEAYNEEVLDRKNLRKAKKELKEIMAVKEVDDSGETQDITGETIDDNPLKLCQIQISRRHQQNFGDQIIRRTVKSFGFDKKPILPLPPCVSILGVVELTKREKDLITVLAEEVVDE